MKNVTMWVAALALATSGAASAAKTKLQMSELMSHLRGNNTIFKVTSDPIEYGGQTPSAAECKQFRAKVLASIEEAVKASDLLFDFIEHLSHKAPHAITIRCAKFQGGNTGHTWPVMAGATIKKNGGGNAASCSNLATYTHVQACLQELMDAGDNVHAAIKKVANTARDGGRDVVVALHHTAGPTSYKVFKPVDTVYRADNANGGNLRCSGGRATPTPLAGTVFHELIHAAKIASGKYVAGGAPVATFLTAADVKAFHENIVALTPAVVMSGVAGDANAKRNALVAAMKGQHGLTALQALANSSYGNGADIASNDDYEEFQNLLTQGYPFDGKRLTENHVRKALGYANYRCQYSK